jgi:hypothetical protein
MKTKFKFFILTLLVGSLTTIFSCKDEEVFSVETEILSFSLAEETGPAEIDKTAHTIDIEVVTGTDLESLSPTFSVSTGATSAPSSGTASDYSTEFTITVTAEDGATKQAWKVNVSKVASDETDILSFTLADETGAATIDATAHTVAIEVAEGTNPASLTPTFTLSPGATSVPASETADNYTEAVTITVTAQDGEATQPWTVTVTVAVGPSDATDILTFSFPEQISIEASTTNHTIDVVVASGTALTALTPTFTISANATSTPTTGTTEDYSSPVTITVTAEDATTTEDWTVTVTVAAAPGTTTVLFGDGGTDKATGITDLVVDGVTYDMEFVYGSPAAVYGAFPGDKYTFTTSATAQVAIAAINVALNGTDATLIGIVGEEDFEYHIGWEGEGSVRKECSVSRGEYKDASWVDQIDSFKLYDSVSSQMYAVFTPK